MMKHCKPNAVPPAAASRLALPNRTESSSMTIFLPNCKTPATTFALGVGPRGGERPLKTATLVGQKQLEVWLGMDAQSLWLHSLSGTGAAETADQKRLTNEALTIRRF
jgi:hypothetical protein